MNKDCPRREACLRSTITFRCVVAAGVDQWCVPLWAGGALSGFFWHSWWRIRSQPHGKLRPWEADGPPEVCVVARPEARNCGGEELKLFWSMIISPQAKFWWMMLNLYLFNRACGYRAHFAFQDQKRKGLVGPCFFHRRMRQQRHQSQERMGGSPWLYTYIIDFI